MQPSFSFPWAPGESSLLPSPQLGKVLALSGECADGLSSPDRWAQSPKVKVPRVICVPPPAVGLVTGRIESCPSPAAALCFPACVNLFQ